MSHYIEDCLHTLFDGMLNFHSGFVLLQFTAELGIVVKWFFKVSYIDYITNS